ncbi:MAG: SDR family NAD(P)-dependent oxidoreductase, partial [Deltaproteobacteria bacterium]
MVNGAAGSQSAVARPQGARQGHRGSVAGFRRRAGRRDARDSGPRGQGVQRRPARRVRARSGGDAEELARAGAPPRRACDRLADRLPRDVPAPSASLQGQRGGRLCLGSVAGRLRQDRRGDRCAGAQADPAGAARAPPLREHRCRAQPARRRRRHRRRARVHAGPRSHAPAQPDHCPGLGGRVREGRGAAPFAGSARGRRMKALVTGASRGIGLAVAEALIADGAQVTVCASRSVPEVSGAALARRC